MLGIMSSRSLVFKASQSSARTSPAVLLTAFDAEAGHEARPGPLFELLVSSSSVIDENSRALAELDAGLPTNSGAVRSSSRVVLEAASKSCNNTALLHTSKTTKHAGLQDITKQITGWPDFETKHEPMEAHTALVNFQTAGTIRKHLAPLASESSATGSSWRHGWTEAGPGDY
jgi:hypothetical protein